MSKNAVLFVFDGYADWEPALAIAELRRTFGFSVRTAGLGLDPVRSMGGLTVTPDIDLAELDSEATDLLIIPGGSLLMEGEISALTKVLKGLDQADKTAAGICSGTMPIAHAELLNDRDHTSNGPEFLAANIPLYTGMDRYRFEPAVSDRGVITAGGVSPVAFAREIFIALSPENKRDIIQYTGLFGEEFKTEEESSPRCPHSAPSKN